jgi:SHS2 domain-containing protein
LTRYTTLDHTGDIGIEWEADDLPALFRGGAWAFADLVAGDPGEAEGMARDFDLDGVDLPDLLVRFLQELLFRFETRGELLPRIEVKILEGGGEGRRARLTATAHGRAFDPSREEVRLVIKAVTYHALEVAPRPEGGWRARVIFDV